MNELMLFQKEEFGQVRVVERNGEPWFVADKDLEKNELIVVQGGDHEKLYSKALIADNFNFINKRSLIR